MRIVDTRNFYKSAREQYPDLFSSHRVRKVIYSLYRIALDSKNLDIKLRAAKLFLDRALGTPVPAVPNPVEAYQAARDATLADMGDEELVAEAKRIVQGKSNESVPSTH